jgi:hypothetical protein
VGTFDKINEQGYHTLNIRNPIENQDSTTTQFLMHSHPIITNVTPSQGIAQGGDIIVLIGSGFKLKGALGEDFDSIQPNIKVMFILGDTLSSNDCTVIDHNTIT